MMPFFLLHFLLLYLTIVPYSVVQCKNKDKRHYNPEEERDVPVKIKLLGDLATPHPDSGIELGFVPKQVYYQVRRYDTKKRVPQSEALKEAKTPEEVINAPRLREVLTHKKTQEVYEEQGYEDAGYDHGGSAKHKENHEKILEDDTVTFGKGETPEHFDEPDTDSHRTEGEDLGYEIEESRQNKVKGEIPKNISHKYKNLTKHHKKLKPNIQSILISDFDSDIDEEEKSKRKSKNTNKTDESIGHYRPSHLFSSSEKKIKKYDTKNHNKKDVEEVDDHVDERKNKKKSLSKIAQNRNDENMGEQIKNPKLDFDTVKYPFYIPLNSNKYTKHSALKYAMNPKHIPIKVANKMSFYDSRTRHCDEVTGPEVELPKGEEKNPDNAELHNPNRGKPRMGKLGGAIDCLKKKFFGHDPLDNPFFKENF